MSASVYGQIVEAQHSIENALNHAEIQESLAAYHYNREKLLEGKVLCQQTHILHMSKFGKYGDQHQTTRTLNADVTRAKKKYKRHLKIARLAFEDKPGIQKKLMLRGRRKDNLKGWMEQAHVFYHHIEEVMETITRYGADQEDLLQTKLMVEAIAASKQQQMQTMGEAQHTTEQRDATLKELNTWMQKFKQTARLALQDKPQLLEILGIKVPSVK